MATASSPTPLAKKLGLRSGSRLALIDAPAGWSIPNPPSGLEFVAAEDSVDVVVAFHSNLAAYLDHLSDLARLIFPDGALWVAWPRKAAGHLSDLGDAVVRAAALDAGLVDVKVAALDEDWSALKLCWRTENRRAGPPMHA